LREPLFHQARNARRPQRRRYSSASFTRRATRAALNAAAARERLAARRQFHQARGARYPQHTAAPRRWRAKAARRMSCLVDQRVRRTQRHRGRWAMVALLSVLAHALFLGALLLENALNPPAPVITPQAVALRSIDAQEWERRRGPRAPLDSR